MSSRAELKAKSLKKFNKRRQRADRKKSRDDDNDSSADDLDNCKLLLPTPSEYNASITGKHADKISEKVKQKDQANRKNSLNSIQSLNNKKIDFTNAKAFTRQFWDGPPGEAEPSDDLKQLRKSIGIVVKGNVGSCPPPIVDIQDQHLHNGFRSVFDHIGINEPTPVQKQSWPAVLNGANVLAIAPTGSGKTLAYSLPMIPHIEHQIKQNKGQIDEKKLSPYGLVVVPTRELALQVAHVLRPFKKLHKIYSSAIYGGQDREEQLEKIVTENRKLHVLVATPGRLLDYLANTNLLTLSHITYLVIDEADRMLTMGFFEQLSIIHNHIRPDRQTLLFSATFPGKLREISEMWLSNPVIIRVNAMEFQDRSKGKAPTLPTTTATTVISNDNSNSNGNSNNCVMEVDSSNNVNDESKKSKKRKNSISEESVENTPATNVDAKSNDNNEELDDSNKKKKKKKDKEKLIDATTKEETVDDSNNDSTTAVEPQQQATSTPTIGEDTEEVLPKRVFNTSLTISKTITQKIHVCTVHKKPRLLIRYLEGIREREKQEKKRQADAIMIFCNKIKTMAVVHDFLAKQDYKGDLLHGRLPQAKRELVLNNFKAGKTSLLICTDVAARGLHIKRLKYVINYDFPSNIEQYCHRVGRVGRQGEIGYSMSFITRNMAPLANDLATLLRTCDQEVEKNLIALCSDYNNGRIERDEEEDEDDDDDEVEEEV